MADVAVDGTGRAGPLVSVVIPVYRVEEYVGDCIASVLGQTHRELEVLVVDDGTPDRSVEVLLDRAAGDPRVSVTRVRNAGLGAARNTGASKATGTYLCFVDSDDVLPPDAIATLVASLEKTGSDVALGNVHRIVGDEQPQSLLHRRSLTRHREGVRLVDVPALVNATTSCNGLFRRAFWTRHGLYFPVGSYYEDLATMARALTLATGIDTTGTVTYLWRVREDNSSISQQRTDARVLADRLTALSACEAVYRPLGAEVVGALLRKILTFDLPLYLTAAAEGGEEVRTLLREAVEEYWSRGVLEATDVIVGMGVRDRVRYHLVRTGRWADLPAADAWLREHADLLPWRFTWRSWRKVPELDVRGVPALAGLPTEVLDVRPNMTLRATAEAAHWEGDVLVVTGRLRLRHVAPPARVSALASIARGGESVVAPVSVDRPAADGPADERPFTARIPLGRAQTSPGRGTSTLTLTAMSAPVTVDQAVRWAPDVPTDTLGPAESRDGSQLTAARRPRGVVKVKVTRSTSTDH